MAVDTYGPKKQPQFSAQSAPDTAADLTTVAAYAATYGNRATGTTAERQAALTAGNVWEGLIWGDTTDGNEYRMTGGAWVIYSMSTPRYRDNMLYGGSTDPNTGTGYSWAMWTIAAGFCHVQYSVYLGVNSNVGSGNWGLRMPVTATVQGGRVFGAGHYIRANGSNFTLMCICDGTTYDRFNILTNDGGVRISSTTSSIGAGDRILAFASYPVIPGIAG